MARLALRPLITGLRPQEFLQFVTERLEQGPRWQCFCLGSLCTDPSMQRARRPLTSKSELRVPVPYPRDSRTPGVAIQI